MFIDQGVYTYIHWIHYDGYRTPLHLQYVIIISFPREAKNISLHMYLSKRCHITFTILYSKSSILYIHTALVLWQAKLRQNGNARPETWLAQNQYQSVGLKSSIQVCTALARHAHIIKVSHLAYAEDQLGRTKVSQMPHASL